MPLGWAGRACRFRPMSPPATKPSLKGRWPGALWPCRLGLAWACSSWRRRCWHSGWSAGWAFEYIRFTARHLSNPLVRLLILPNLALQRLTTREPDDTMLEVAIAAFRAMRAEELQAEEPQPEPLAA